MDAFARLPARDRRALFSETAARRGFASAVAVEKDFWVCWTLRRLYGLEGVPDLLFKGGTSLSKGFGLIERFSEDIDIALDRAALGFGGKSDPLAIPSRKKREAAIKQLGATCESTVGGVILKGLRHSFERELSGSFGIRIDTTEKNPCDIVFDYPPSLTDSDYGVDAYIPKVVRIEFGARSDHEPIEHADVVPFVAEEFPDAFESPSTRVRLLAAERTFWEKATILHAENGRSVGDSLPRQWTRLSRHCYDLFMLIRSDVGDRALARLDLLEAVAQHKQAFYPAGWADYSAARPGTFRLVPRGPFLDALRADYQSMREMFPGDPPTFGEIVDLLENVEGRVNGDLGD